LPASELRVALTFDAEHPSRPHCPPGNAQRVLDALARANARATFFIQGRWATAYPRLAREIAYHGHRLGNHTQFHARLRLLTDDGIRFDIQAAENNIREVTGPDPRPWFRCPFGDGADDDRVQQSLAALGYQHVPWDVDSQDWQDDQAPSDIVQTVLAGVQARGDGAIVLLHSWPAGTATAMSGLIAGLRSLGARFATVDELLLNAAA
jgi:peptidoglycan/xylan/chitin deacetylase (PgdA/CDA1 family)